MKSLCVTYVIAIGCWNFALPALAQNADAQKPKAKTYPGLWGVVGHDEVHAELDVSSDQISELKALSNRLREKWNQGKDGKFEDRQQLYRGLRKEFDSQIGDVIDQKQRKRFMEIYYQLNPSPYLLANKTFTANLDLSENQKLKIKEQVAQYVEQNATINRKHEDSQQKRNQLVNAARMKAYKEAMSVLTDEQQKKFKAALGKPFSLE